MSKTATNSIAVIAEFKNPSILLKAAAKVREAKYTKFDCYSPFPIHGMNEAMGLRPSNLGWIVFFVGISSAALAYLLQWWVHTQAYPLIYSGKPFNSYQAWVIVIFEMTILFSGFATFFGMLLLNGLPRWHQPIFESKKLLQRASDDGFLLGIEAIDPNFSENETKAFLQELGAIDMEVVHSEQN